jgi:ABC-type phosphate/phosphonate transport system substrate-binding protein
MADSIFQEAPEPVLQVVMKPFKKVLESEVGLTGLLVAGGDPIALGGKLKEGKVQLGVFHGVEFAWAKKKYPTLEALVIAVNRYRVLTACLVVRRNGSIKAVGNLKGKKVALPAGSREHCRLFLENRCVKPGGKPSTFFDRVTAPTDIEDALDDVVDNKVQAAVVDLVSLEAFAREKPGRARQLTTLLKSEPFPCGVIAYQPGQLSSNQLKRLRNGLTAARSSKQGQQMLETMRLTAFENVPADFSKQLSNIAEAYSSPSR